jgi:hypothetical protein
VNDIGPLYRTSMPVINPPKRAAPTEPMKRRERRTAMAGIVMKN